MRFHKVTEPVQWGAVPFVSIFCDEPSHEEWRLYSFSWTQFKGLEHGWYAVQRDYADGDGVVRHYTRSKEFDPAVTLEGDGAESRKLDKHDLPTSPALRKSWTLKCERCGLSVRARDENLQRALRSVNAVGESRVSLRTLGAIVRSNR